MWPGAATGEGSPTDRPEKIASYFVSQGAQMLHLVDLDGAQRGAPVNTDADSEASRARGAVPLQLAGGVDGPEQIELAFAAGRYARRRAAVGSGGDRRHVCAPACARGERLAGRLASTRGPIGWRSIRGTDLCRRSTALVGHARLRGCTPAGRVALDRSTHRLARRGHPPPRSGAAARRRRERHWRGRCGARRGADALILGEALFSGAIEFTSVICEG